MQKNKVRSQVDDDDHHHHRNIMQKQARAERVWLDCVPGADVKTVGSARRRMLELLYYCGGWSREVRSASHRRRFPCSARRRGRALISPSFCARSIFPSRRRCCAFKSCQVPWQVDVWDWRFLFPASCSVLLSANCVCWSSTSMLSSIVCGNRGCLLFKMWGFFFYVRFWKRRRFILHTCGSGMGRRVHFSDLPVLETSEGFILHTCGSGMGRRVHFSEARRRASNNTKEWRNPV
jgi:hypothetical protein